MTTISQDQYYMQAGVTVAVLSNTSLLIEGGWSSLLWQGVAAGWGNDIVNAQDDIIIDMLTVGLNGRDHGSAGLPPNGAYDIWLLYNPTTNAKGAIATTTRDIRSTVFPPGFTDNRQVEYFQPVISGRCIPTHEKHGVITFTDSDPMMTLPLTLTSFAGWVAFDLSGYTSSTCRMCTFAAAISGNGSLWVSPSSNVPNVMYKNMALNQSGVMPPTRCRLDGDQRVYFWFQGTGTCQIFLREAVVTQRS